jgi:hypothetical protein
MDPLNPSRDPNATPGATPSGGFDPAGSQPPVWSVPAMPVPPPVVSAPLKNGSSKRRRDPLTLVMFAAAFVAVGGVGFATGRVTAPAAAVTTGSRFGNGGNFPTGSFAPGGNGGGLAGGRGGFGGGVSVRGTVTEVAADHITIKLANGTTLSIPIDSTTTYHSQAAATAGDVKSGVTVQVEVGAANGAGGGRVTDPNASAAPGGNGFGRSLGTASDITIVGQ